MIANDARILRELEAEPRTFQTVKGAMTWYTGQLQARARVNRDLASVGTPKSRAAIEQANATFAKIANCLKATHHTDPTDPDYAAATRYRITGEMLLWLMAWYESTWGDGQWLADKAGITRWSFTRRCRRTERALRTRLEGSGLIAT